MRAQNPQCWYKNKNAGLKQQITANDAASDSSVVQLSSKQAKRCDFAPFAMTFLEIVEQWLIKPAITFLILKKWKDMIKIYPTFIKYSNIHLTSLTYTSLLPFFTFTRIILEKSFQQKKDEQNSIQALFFIRPSCLNKISSRQAISLFLFPIFLGDANVNFGKVWTTFPLLGPKKVNLYNITSRKMVIVSRKSFWLRWRVIQNFSSKFPEESHKILPLWKCIQRVLTHYWNVTEVLEGLFLGQDVVHTTSAASFFVVLKMEVS